MRNDRDDYVLFIDETGTASLRDVDSPYYILSGCAVTESERHRIKTWADHIKFKYWNTTDIVFHSREMSRKEGKFKIFKDEAVYENFLADLEVFLTEHDLHMFYVLVDKKKIRAAERANNKEFPEWNDNRIYKETSDLIIKNFLCFLMMQRAHGKIVIESATAEKDFYFHKSLGTYLGNGVKGTGITDKEVKETLTSISFVTKDNHDTEEQIADLLAYAGKYRYYGAKPEQYEAMMLKIVNKKMATEDRIEKMHKLLRPKYAKFMNNYETLPVTKAKQPHPKTEKKSAEKV